MAKMKSVWGIDIGQTALKALELRSANGQLEVVGLDIVEHPKILSQPDTDARQLVRNALEQFLSRNNVVGSTVCISVPGQSSFTRFVKLPPVEPKKIPDIVRFEAEQQIPFPIVDVIWRWQTFLDPDSPDVEVGIFAMKRSDIDETLSHFRGVEMDVDVVQMAPLALYNFMMYDDQVAEDGATLLADVGADKTDLVVADGPRIWTRTIQIGGNNFTEALVKAFKLSFTKAEKLKRTAASSKYARQIFQAMRPVFADLVQEIQRSIGYYTSLHREARFKRLVGLGNGFRLPGLQKFLEQNLSVPVVRVDSYNKLQPSPTVNAPVFAENVLTFAVAYGMAVQGLGQAAVSTNLLPTQITRSREWNKKRPWFAAAAAALLLVIGTKVFRTYADNSALKDQGGLGKAKVIAGRLGAQKNALTRTIGEGRRVEGQIKEALKLYEYRDYWPSLQRLILEGIAIQATDQRLLAAYAAAPSDDDRKQALATIKKIPRDGRLMIFIEKMETSYTQDVAAAAEDLRNQAGGAGSAGGMPARDSFDQDEGEGGGRRGFEIYITGRTPLRTAAADPLLRGLFDKWDELAKNNPSISVVEHQVVDYPDEGAIGGRGGRRDYRPARYDEYRGARRTGAGDEEALTAEIEDPMFPDDPSEDVADDTRFVIGLVVSIDEPTSRTGN